MNLNKKKIQVLFIDKPQWEAGWHKVTFIGDWKETFIIGAKILGLEILEEGQQFFQNKK